MPNQYSKLTRTNILRKVNRKRNPVRNLTQLAQEFGVETSYRRHTGINVWGLYGHRAPVDFVKQVRALVGDRIYKQIREDSSVPLMYR